MVDYAKKKNDELAALCKERSLPHTGKKADLVKRLEDFDAKDASAPDSAPAKSVAAEDEIDWDDDAKAATTEPAAAAIAAGGVGEVANPLAVPNQEAAIDPSKTNDLTVVAPSEQPAAQEAESESTMEHRTLAAEIEKRKARARKFGMPENSEEIKALERALRFGATDLPGLLNKALPAKSERTDRKRGRASVEPEGGVRKAASRARKGGDRPKPVNGKTETSKPSQGGAAWMNDKDREAAERRKAKFATAA
ncbi:uncharacterized protein RCC_06323 [Ramularia collo-cygni]|uniref:SAP domain-containing protein n=1 Tax=Ramularia collo-cygni TaxID=112498 RepID=A0A2D3VI49_9PEZI|nr:uncharacterized protein RCC_06323 [Ramularia collo-cygni]CZT20463.1 uncharacterized protein RCC_06323 [Ramularia collo-cygni]